MKHRSAIHFGDSSSRLRIREMLLICLNIKPLPESHSTSLESFLLECVEREYTKDNNYQISKKFLKKEDEWLQFVTIVQFVLLDGLFNFVFGANLAET